MPSLNSIERPRLFYHLQTALAAGHVLLAASAGYGKTTLLRHFAHRHPNTYYLPLTLADLDLKVLKLRLQPLLQPHHTPLLDDIHLVAQSSEVGTWLSDQLHREGRGWC